MATALRGMASRYGFPLVDDQTVSLWIIWGLFTENLDPNISGVRKARKEGQTFLQNPRRTGEETCATRGLGDAAQTNSGGRISRVAPSGRRLTHQLDLSGEIIEVGEPFVDRCKTDVCDCVDIAETLEYGEPNSFRLHLCPFEPDGLFDIGRHVVEDVVVDRQVLCCGSQTVQHFHPIERLPHSVALDHNYRNFLDPFVRSEPPHAAKAFPPPANGRAVVGGS
jgi:hypothetical protein